MIVAIANYLVVVGRAGLDKHTCLQQQLHSHFSQCWGSCGGSSSCVAYYYCGASSSCAASSSSSCGSSSSCAASSFSCGGSSSCAASSFFVAPLFVILIALLVAHLIVLLILRVVAPLPVMLLLLPVVSPLCVLLLLPGLDKQKCLQQPQYSRLPRSLINAKHLNNHGIHTTRRVGEIQGRLCGVCSAVSPQHCD